MVQHASSASEPRPHRHQPVRTCIGCRQRELAVDLLRTVAVSTGDGIFAVAVDTAGNLPGRGAWLHPTPRCLHAAVRRRAFTRALRITGSPDTTAVAEHLGVLDPPHDRQATKNMSTP
ncbi:YlxR family protein [Mycobacterium sp. 1274756.6]|uniref:YlxR family protein n=1 Tax=Mycobacterium sp. 1274756.6 TaxID=1834076 RepID=UPI0009EE4D32|nr:YlxR family protein [Mycobacterium sp. 1274756.6]